MTTNTTTETLIEALRNAIDGGDAPMHRDYETMRDAMIVSILPVIQAHQPDSDALLREAREVIRDSQFHLRIDMAARHYHERAEAFLPRIDAFLANPTAPTSDAGGRVVEYIGHPELGTPDPAFTQPDAAAPSTDARRAVGPRDDQSQLLRRFLARHYTVYLSDAECRAIVDFFDERPLFDPFWRPIETVPKDGSPILLFDPEYCDEEMNPALQGHWCEGFFAAVWNNSQDYFATVEVHPTYWMPLPRIDATQPDAAAPSDVGALARFHELLGSFGLVLTDDPDFDHDDETFGKAQHALLAALKQPSNSAREWRPIETAPKPAALRASTGTEGEGEDV